METPTYKTFEDKAEDDKLPSEKASEDETARWDLAWAIVIVFTYVGLGSLMLCFVADLHPLTALYVTLQVTTTIGYGDVTEDQLEWQIFMIFYIIFGIAIVANILDAVFNFFLNSSMDTLRATVKKVMDNLGKECQPASVAKQKGWVNLTVSAITLLGLVLLWATVFMMVEECTCSYGWTFIKGCLDDTIEQCKETGGKVKSWGSTLYFAIVTFSTVGFGDFSPKSLSGRAISLILMPLGVLAFVNFVAALSQLIGAYRRDQSKKQRLPPDVLKWVDKDKSGTLDKREFCLYYLLKEGVIGKEDLQHIDQLFDALNKRKKGSLSYDARTQTIEGIDIRTLHTA